jgi:acyl-CoA synthetase
LLLRDGPGVHAALVGAEKAGVIAVGIGPRAGDREVAHLLSISGATALITQVEHQGQPMTDLVSSLRAEGLPLEHHIVLPEPLLGGDVLIDGAPAAGPLDAELERLVSERRMEPSELFLINSTSGTTGLPKGVMHNQSRWSYFHQLAVEAGRLTSSDVFLVAIPTPFGFGLWTSHFTPTYLGIPTVVFPRFSPELTIELIEREQATVLCCVTTQFIMLLNSPAFDPNRLRSLRVMFTGGEPVPYDRAAEFEDRVGAQVLQFYGSNETGAISRTSTTDSRMHRLTTAGRVVEGMHVRLLDGDGADVTASGGPGQPICRGPSMCLGYYGDEQANAELVTPDGWMVTGDIATIDDEGYLRVIGRTSDFIIRGGKNVSARAVEDAVGSHPAVAMVAAVAMPDDVFGERVCAYVVLRSGCSLTLTDLVAHLGARGVSKDVCPERLEVVDELPRASGGKVAKADLRADIRGRLAAERDPSTIQPGDVR